MITDVLMPNPLIASPKSWFSWDFSVLHEDNLITELDLSVWREKGNFMIDGIEYQVSREGLISVEFKLEAFGNLVAKAEKTSVFKRSFLISVLGKDYQLRSKSVFGRSFILYDGNKEVGVIKAANIFNRKAFIDLSNDLPLHVKIFILWLVIIMWKRQSNSNGGS